MTIHDHKDADLSADCPKERDGFSIKAPYAAPVLVELDVDSTDGTGGPNFDGDFSPQS